MEQTIRMPEVAHDGGPPPDHMLIAGHIPATGPGLLVLWYPRRRECQVEPLRYGEPWTVLTTAHPLAVVEGPQGLLSVEFGAIAPYGPAWLFVRAAE